MNAEKDPKPSFTHCLKISYGPVTWRKIKRTALGGFPGARFVDMAE
jgi:hypothetical protein